MIALSVVMSLVITWVGEIGITGSIRVHRAIEKNDNGSVMQYARSHYRVGLKYNES